MPVIAVIFDDVLDAVRLLDRLAEVADEAAVDDRVARFAPRSITVAISPGRSNGMVATTTPPAFSTPSHAANIV